MSASNVAISHKTLVIEHVVGEHWDEAKGSFDKTLITPDDVAQGSARKLIEV